MKLEEKENEARNDRRYWKTVQEDFSGFYALYRYHVSGWISLSTSGGHLDLAWGTDPEVGSRD